MPHKPKTPRPSPAEGPTVDSRTAREAKLTPADKPHGTQKTDAQRKEYLLRFLKEVPYPQYWFEEYLRLTERFRQPIPEGLSYVRCEPRILAAVRQVYHGLSTAEWRAMPYDEKVEHLKIVLATLDAPQKPDESPVAPAPPATDAPAAGKPIDDNVVGHLLQLTGDGTGLRVYHIARDKSKPANDRMYALVELDRRYDGYDSAQWGKLLDVASGAVRQTEFWRTRKQRREER